MHSIIDFFGNSCYTKIKEECENSNTLLPEYEISERGIMVLCKPGEKYIKLLKKYGLGAKTENEPQNEPQTKLLEIIAGNPSISKKRNCGKAKCFAIYCEKTNYSVA